MDKSVAGDERWSLARGTRDRVDDVEIWNAKPYLRWAGVRMIEAREGLSLLELNVEDHHRGGASSSDNINGAIIAYLHDIAQGAAVRSMWHVAHTHMATISLNIQYLRLLKSEKRVVGRGRLVQTGTTVAYAESELLDDHGNICSRSTGQFRLFRKDL